MGGAGIFDDAALTTTFPTTFYGGNSTPVELTLTADQVVLTDFELPTGTSELNPVRIGPGTANGTFTRLAEIPLPLGPALHLADVIERRECRITKLQSREREELVVSQLEPFALAARTFRLHVGTPS
jgi:hypothetical protein